MGGCAALKTPFSRLSCSSQGSHFKQKSQITRPPFEISSLNSLNFRPNFSSQAPKFGNFQFASPHIGKFSVHKPQIWKVLVHKPAFQRQKQFASPTSEILAAHPYLKKVECPPQATLCSPHCSPAMVGVESVPRSRPWEREQTGVDIHMGQ